MIAYLFLAVGLVLVLEGMIWAAAPQMIERMLEMLRDLPETARRQIGVLAILLGLILLWIAVLFGA